METIATILFIAAVGIGMAGAVAPALVVFAASVVALYFDDENKATTP